MLLEDLRWGFGCWQRECTVSDAREESSINAFRSRTIEHRGLDNKQFSVMIDTVGWPDVPFTSGSIPQTAMACGWHVFIRRRTNFKWFQKTGELATWSDLADKNHKDGARSLARGGRQRGTIVQSSVYLNATTRANSGSISNE